jgi:hypothetical protein
MMSWAGYKVQTAILQWVIINGGILNIDIDKSFETLLLHVNLSWWSLAESRCGQLVSQDTCCMLFTFI